MKASWRLLVVSKDDHLDTNSSPKAQSLNAMIRGKKIYAASTAECTRSFPQLMVPWFFHTLAKFTPLVRF